MWDGPARPEAACDGVGQVPLRRVHGALEVLESMLRRGRELLGQLHQSSVERRRPDTPMSRRLDRPDPAATPEQADQWSEEQSYCTDALRGSDKTVWHEVCAL